LGPESQRIVYLARTASHSRNAQLGLSYRLSSTVVCSLRTLMASVLESQSRDGCGKAQEGGPCSLDVRAAGVRCVPTSYKDYLSAVRGCQYVRERCHITPLPASSGWHRHRGCKSSVTSSEQSIQSIPGCSVIAMHTVLRAAWYSPQHVSSLVSRLVP